MAENYGIGLDGGTTESCIIAGGFVVKIHPGHSTYASVVRVRSDGSFDIPTPLQAPTDYTPHFALCKRMIGRPPEDGSLRHTVERITHAKLDGGGPHYVAGERRIELVEVWAYILGRALQAATSSRSGPPRKVVLTVPAYYGIRQCEAIRTAADIAGFDMDNTRLVTEPLAITVDQIEADRQEKTGLYPNESCVVVVDVGGGTTDVNEVVVEDSGGTHSYVVQAIEGDIFLGGADFKQIMVALVREKVKSAGHVGGLDSDVLLRECENAKINLSCAQSTTIDLDTGGPPLLITISRAEFEEACIPLLERISEVIDRLPIVKTGKAPTAVFLAGGASQMPCIQELCRRRFPKTTVTLVQDAQQVVARGAWRISEAEHIVVHNVLSTSIGVEARFPDPIPEDEKRQRLAILLLASRNMRVPTRVTHTLYTNEENQSQLELTFVEGESMEKDLNTVVGEMKILDIPACPIGTKINVHLTIEGPGNFLVRATVGDVEQELKVEPPAFLTAVEIGKYRAATACRLDGKAGWGAPLEAGALSEANDTGIGEGADHEPGDTILESNDGSASERSAEAVLARTAGGARSGQKSAPGSKKDGTGKASLDELRVRKRKHGSVANRRVTFETIQSKRKKTARGEGKRRDT